MTNDRGSPMLWRFLLRLYESTLAPIVNWLFFHHLVARTQNFGHIKWRGLPVWQNVFDLWTILETIHEVQPALLIECGTNRGGSAVMYGQFFDLAGRGRVISIDVEKMHDLSHPRVEFLIGSSVDPDMIANVREAVANADGPVMVILDSDHSRNHVLRELEAYAPLVTPGSYCLVQDGVIDKLMVFRNGRPGPLPAIRDFLRCHPEFEVDQARCDRFLITHHPAGWLRRKPTMPVASPR